jgi:hypothetical protein
MDLVLFYLREDRIIRNSNKQVIRVEILLFASQMGIFR